MSLLEIFFHHALEELEISFFPCAEKVTNFLSWLEKQDCTVKKKFLYSFPKKHNFSELFPILGDSLNYVSSDMTFENFLSWYSYHENIYKDWQGEVFDCMCVYQYIPLEILLGKMTKNLNFPLDVLTHYYFQTEKEMPYYIYLLLSMSLFIQEMRLA